MRVSIKRTPPTSSEDKLYILIALKKELLNDLLAGAIEGGSNYWAKFTGFTYSTTNDISRVRVDEWDKSGAKQILTHVDTFAIGEGLRRLSEAEFATAGDHLGNALGGNWDAETADVVLQMAVFGDVIYG